MLIYCNCSGKTVTYLEGHVCRPRRSVPPPVLLAAVVAFLVAFVGLTVGASLFAGCTPGSGPPPSPPASAARVQVSPLASADLDTSREDACLDAGLRFRAWSCREADDLGAFVATCRRLQREPVYRWDPACVLTAASPAGSALAPCGRVVCTPPVAPAASPR